MLYTEPAKQYCTLGGEDCVWRCESQLTGSGNLGH